MKHFYLILTLSLFTLLESCKEDDINTHESIFDTTTPEMNEFDQWLYTNYVHKYNIDFKYRFEDIQSDMDYNLVPAQLDKAKVMAELVQYLWLESYDELLDEHFMRQYGPKMIHLVGSPCVNANSGTIVLGTAEGGLKITLYNINSLNPTDISTMNELYFKTMHHEFAHILHQNKNYPVDFEKISTSDYSPMGWMNRDKPEQYLPLGFVSAYAGSEPREDFVEIISIFITNSDSYWQGMLTAAGEEGASIINQKFDIVTSWLKTAWQIDIKQLRDVVQRRSQEVVERYSTDQ